MIWWSLALPRKNVRQSLLGWMPLNHIPSVQLPLAMEMGLGVEVPGESISTTWLVLSAIEAPEPWRPLVVTVAPEINSDDFPTIVPLLAIVVPVTLSNV